MRLLLASLVISVAGAALAAEPCTPTAEALEAFLARAPKPTTDVPGFTAPAVVREATKLLQNVMGTLPATSDALAKAQGSLEANLDADVSHLLNVDRCPMAQVFVVASRAIDSHRVKALKAADRNALREAIRQWIRSAPDRRLEAVDLMTRLAVIEKAHRSGLDPLAPQAVNALARLRNDAGEAKRLSVMSAVEWGRAPSLTAYRALNPETRRKLNQKWLDELRAEDALRQRLVAVTHAYDEKTQK